MQKPVPPNEPGKWTLIQAAGSRTCWRRERSDPYPIVQFYVLAPPSQTEVFYNEDQARAHFDRLTQETRAA